jgi:hypothetical protein
MLTNAFRLLVVCGLVAAGPAAFAQSTPAPLPATIPFGTPYGAPISLEHLLTIAQHKARAAALFRRPTQTFEAAVTGGNATPLSLDGAIASQGGLPLVVDGRIIGAIGCSGGTSPQDTVVCQAGVDAAR